MAPLHLEHLEHFLAVTSERQDVPVHAEPHYVAIEVYSVSKRIQKYKHMSHQPSLAIKFNCNVTIARSGALS